MHCTTFKRRPAIKKTDSYTPKRARDRQILPLRLVVARARSARSRTRRGVPRGPRAPPCAPATCRAALGISGVRPRSSPPRHIWTRNIFCRSRGSRGDVVGCLASGPRAHLAGHHQLLVSERDALGLMAHGPPGSSSAIVSACRASLLLRCVHTRVLRAELLGLVCEAMKPDERATSRLDGHRGVLAKVEIAAVRGGEGRTSLA